MVAQVTSSSNPEVEYEVVVEQGQVLHCTCLAQFYHPGKPCRHMKAKQVEVAAEIARAARFLAVKLQVQGMEETWKANREMAWSQW